MAGRALTHALAAAAVKCPAEAAAVAGLPLAVAELPVTVAEHPVAVAELPVTLAEQPVAVVELPAAVDHWEMATCQHPRTGRMPLLWGSCG